MSLKKHSTMWYSHDQTKMDRITSVSDDFEFETRLVVLNFLGLIPTSCPPAAMTIDWPSSHLEHRGSLDGFRSSQEHIGSIPTAGSSESNLLSESEAELKSTEDQLSESYTLIRKGNHVRLLTTGDACFGGAVQPSVVVTEAESSCDNGGFQMDDFNQSLECDGPTVCVIPASPREVSDRSRDGSNISASMPGFLESDGFERRAFNKSVSSDASDEFMHKSLDGSQLKRSSFASSRLSPHQEEVHSSVERQRSLQSRFSGSVRSLASFERNSYVDVRQVDVTPLVRAQTLPPEAVHLKEEISKEVKDLEKCFMRSRPEKLPPLLLPGPVVSSAAASPESQVADMLRAIGDRVEDNYSIALNYAMDELLLQQQNLGRLTYDALQEAAGNLLRHSAMGWTRVALVLLLSQKLSLALLAHGDRNVGLLADYTARFIMDNIADFILSRGGWQSIAEIGVTETPLPISDECLLPPSASVDRPTSEPAADRLHSSSAAAGLLMSHSVIHSCGCCTKESCDNMVDLPDALDGVQGCEDPVIFAVQNVLGGSNTARLENGKPELISSNLPQKDCLDGKGSKGRIQLLRTEAVESCESFENDECNVGLIIGVLILVVLGTWIVIRRVRKG